jgi:hypothetical protein
VFCACANPHARHDPTNDTTPNDNRKTRLLTECVRP